MVDITERILDKLNLLESRVSRIAVDITRLRAEFEAHVKYVERKDSSSISRKSATIIASVVAGISGVIIAIIELL